MSHLVHGTCVIAVDDENGKIVGVLIAGPIKHTDADEMIENAKISSKKWGDIQRLLAYIEKKADVLGKFNLDVALHCQVLSVHKDYRGNRIGQKLFDFCFENAKKLGFKLMSVDCTSVFSIHVAEKLNMEYISTVTYDEYNQTLGEKLFIPIAPNFEIKTFIRHL
jgi:GNAT superfamily N-acetyltransferase